MIVVSACLAGKCCRYDGKSSISQRIVQLVESGDAITVCPEVLGGLTTPRPKAEMKNGYIITQDNTDLTKEFMLGARKAVTIALQENCTHAILKSKSPSCGSGKIFDGTFSGKLIKGEGIFSALLKENNISVQDEQEFENTL